MEMHSRLALLKSKKTVQYTSLVKLAFLFPNQRLCIGVWPFFLDNGRIRDDGNCLLSV